MQDLNVWIKGEWYPINRESEQRTAMRAMSQARLNSAVVFCNGTRTNFVLLADSDVDPVANGTKVR